MNLENPISRIITSLRHSNKMLHDKSAFNRGKVNKWLSSLPLGDVGQTSQLLIDRINIVNQTECDADDRLHFLAQLTPAIQYIFNHINDHLFRQQYSDIRQIQKSSDLLITLFESLTLGYVTTVLSYQTQNTLKKSTLKIIQESSAQTLYYLSKLQYIHYRSYRELPHYFWKEANALYFLAEQTRLLKEKVSGLGHKQLSIEELYKQLMMFELASPYQLHPNYLDELSHLLENWGSNCELSGYNGMTQAFVIDIALGNGPYKDTFITNPTNTLRIISFQRVLAGLSHYSFTALERLPPISALLVTHLETAWSTHQQRLFKRSHYKKPIKLSIGLVSIYYLVNPIHNRTVTHNPQIQSAPKVFFNRRIGKYLQEPPKPNLPPVSAHDAIKNLINISDGYIINMSANGCCISIDKSQHCRAVVGDLIALNETQSNFELNWQLAQICWIRQSTQQQLLGLELLAPTICAVDIHTFESRNTLSNPPSQMHKALLLSPIKKNGHHSLISTPLFNKQQLLFVNYNGNALRLKVSDIERATPCFQQLAFNEPLFANHIQQLKNNSGSPTF